MKSKFEEFNDGIMNLYSENENGKLVRKFEDNLRFGEENVSIQRHYAAQAADQQVDKVIHVPLLEIFEAHDVVVIGEEQFDVDKVDNLKSNQPPITSVLLFLNLYHINQLRSYKTLFRVPAYFLLPECHLQESFLRRQKYDLRLY